MGCNDGLIAHSNIREQFRTGPEDESCIQEGIEGGVMELAKWEFVHCISIHCVTFTIHVDAPWDAIGTFIATELRCGCERELYVQMPPIRWKQPHYSWDW